MKIKNKYIVICLVLLSVVQGYSQELEDWQWIASGGSGSSLSTSQPMESVQYLNTDSEGNSYIISTIGSNNPEIADEFLSFYGGVTYNPDYVLASFSCDGSYRWSKTIGGYGAEKISGLAIDSEDYIYVSGTFGACTTNDYHSRIENDTILANTGSACTRLFMAKFNSEGSMEWFRQPQEPMSASLATSSTGSKMITIVDDTLHWIVNIPPGSYAGGNLITTEEDGTHYDLVYDTDGVFQEAIALPISYTGTYGLDAQYFINPVTGDYVIVSPSGNSNDTVTINGEELDAGAFLTSFDSEGNWQWNKVNTYEDGGGIKFHSISFDEEGDMYIGFRMFGFSYDTFLGVTISEAAYPAVLVKMTPEGTSLWSTYHDKTGMITGDVLYHDGVVAYATAAFGTLTWGDQTITMTSMPTNAGFNALLAFFDANTGECTSLHKLGGDLGFDDNGASLAVDAAGDYLMGGSFGFNLYDANEEQTYIVGGNSDFYVAKFATQACSVLGLSTPTTSSFKMFPNPVAAGGNLQLTTAATGQLVDLSGRVVCRFKQQAVIQIPTIAKGVYFLQLQQQGTHKVLVE